MPQCHYLDSRGRRCPRDAEEGRMFCGEHDPQALQEPPNLRKAALRLAALRLLIVFLVPMLYAAYRILQEVLN